MQMVIESAHACRVKKITTDPCGREFSRQTVINLTERLGEGAEAWAEHPLGKYSFLLADAMQLAVPRGGLLDDGDDCCQH